MKNKRYIATMVGLLLMLGASSTAYGQIVKGKVFGGGKLAKVNGGTAGTACNVTIKSGSVYGKVYGAGEGVKIYEDGYDDDVAKVTGDVKVNVEPGSGGGGTAWQDVFGGGALAKVAGDTYVSMSGGHIAANLFGGGEGDIKKVSSDANAEYDRSSGALVITSADVSGNTNVDITGGDIIWDRTSMASPLSVTTYTYTKTTGGVSGTETYTTTDSEETVDKIKTSFESANYTEVSVVLSSTETENEVTTYTYTVTRTTPIVVLTEEVLSTNETRQKELTDAGYHKDDGKTIVTPLAEGEIVYWDTDVRTADYVDESDADHKIHNELFFDETNKKFKIKHNIFGGGYIACRVGTYNSLGDLQNKKGKYGDNVDSNGDLLDEEGNVVPTGRARVSMVSGMFGSDLIGTQQWKDCYNDNQDPHFYVFGGGFGAYTSVGKTQVQIGVNEEILEAAGETIEQWAKPGHLNLGDETTAQRAKVSRFDAGGINTYNVGGDVDNPTIPIADQQYGEPGYTILGVLGGGYAGIVTGNTDVRVGGNTFMSHIYGGGYGQLAAYNELNTNDVVWTETVNAVEKTYNREDLGMVMGNTYVKTDGGFIQGDVFGGGAGVEWDNYADHDFTMGEVKGATEVEITGETFVQRSVYGGGDVANVLGGTVGTGENDPKQTSTVTVKSGTIVDKVFGGGNGRLVSQVYEKEDDGKAVTVGKIVGNTLVTIEDIKDEETGEIISSPYIYGDIYGGCGYGQVVKTNNEATDGNTVVNINGGNIGGNIYGGGLGKEAESNTSANIAGSTNVTINGGSALWDMVSDDNGNISKWDVQENILTTDAERTAVRLALVTGDTQIFKTLLADKVSDKFFDIEKLEYTKNHNIYGGGDRVCKVAGTANVTVNHALVTDATILNPSNSAGLCWAASIDNKEHPQFSVFGGGYGPNTTVANTVVKYQCGHEEEDFTYESQSADRMNWLLYFGKMALDWADLDAKEKELNYGGNNAAGIWRYAVSQLAWSSGIPNLIMRGVFGGGYAGLVSGNTNVTVSDASCLRYVYGGGLGSKDYLTNYNKEDRANLYNRLGEVAGNSTVTISGGVVSKEVYGGGAGIEPKKLGSDTDFTDLVDMARVKGKTSVIISGSPSVTEEGASGTVIIGDVFGGGDVANVGMEDATIYGTSPVNDLSEENKSKFNYITSQVNITSGCMLGQVFAGGNGRTKELCSGEDGNGIFGYQKVGAIYGNTLLTVNGYDDSSSEGQGGSHDNITYVFKRMFGGGNNGSICKTTGTGGEANSGHTYVTVNGGYFAYNVFGGGVGTINTTVNEETGVKTDNNTYSYVEGDTHVRMLGGLAIVDQYWDKPQTVTVAPGKTIEVGLRQWAPLNEKDGKKYSAQYDPKQKKLLINHNIYAGCRNAGYVLGNTYLTMNKGYIRSGLRAGAYEGVADNFFESQEWEEIYSKIGSPHFCIFGGGFGENTHIKGDTFVDIDIDATKNLGLSSPVELSETHHALPAAQRFEGGQSVMDIIGGGYSGDVAGATHVKVSHDVYARRIFGGSFYAPVSQTNIMINSINCDDIFGGGMMGDVRPTTVKGSTPGSGAGNTNVVIGTPDATTNAKIFINNNVYGGNDVSGEVTGQITASIFGGKIYNNVYGAGNGNYLYALNDKVEKVTTHEYYEANGQNYDLVYEVPLQARMDFNVKSATDAQKIVNINTYRPRAEKVILNLAGTSSQPLTIDGSVFGGGNTATVSSLSGNRPSVTMNIGSYSTIGSVYMGADGEAMFLEKSGFMGAFQNINGVDLTNPIDWLNNVANKSISEEFLPVAKANRPKIYPHVLDLYFEPVEMSVQPTLNWCSNITLSNDGKLTVTPTVATNVTSTTIGTFVSGGNRGNMNVEPWNGSTANYGGNVDKAGQIINYKFPAGLTIQNRIVGGCNNANYTLGKVTHEGGYLLGGRKYIGTEINLLVECDFAPQATADQVSSAKGNSDKIAELSSGNVFGGCYKSGTINGDISIDVRSDMLKNISGEMLKASKDNNVPVASVYGAGYGMESYVYGETEVLFGKGTKSTVSSSAKTMGPKNTGPTTPIIIYGSSAKDVYGGGQQGNLIGNSTIKVLNGHIAGSVVGGSYAGYMWGSTQVLVGYPKYYTVNTSGTYKLKRADKWNDDKKNADGSDAVKQNIKLIKGDIIAEEVYDAINAQDASKTSAGQFTAHIMTPAQDCTDEGATGDNVIKWDDINIKIDDAAYGGGYSLASGSSVGSQTYTVLKYNDEHNLDDMSSDELAPMGGSSKKYGGNTTVLVWDHAAATYGDGSTDKEHIAISTQEMTPVTLTNGTDLFGYYFWDSATNSYKYIFQEGKYKYGTGLETGVTYYQSAYKYDGDGGVYGDGHLSFAEGFRAGEVNGYGFAGSKPNGAKILNTFQRMDMLRVSDCSLVLLGACDYTVNEVSTTPYSIARVGELQMKSDNVAINGTTLYGTDTNRSRNFIGLSNNIHYVGAVTSDVPFTETFHKNDGTEGTTTYRAEKQQYIDNYYGTSDANDGGAGAGQKGIFQRRNDGTAKNMIGIASGYAMKILNTKTIDAAGKEATFYGPIVGVVEVALTNTHADEAGAYVYAANLHRRDAAKESSDPNFVPDAHVDGEDFLETTGNFVFPYNATENRYVIDDCYKTEYDLQKSKVDGEPNSADAEAHYWYVAGWEYYYNAHITGYTYNDPNTFYAENDGSMTLVGTIANSDVTIKSIKWHSPHASDGDDELESRNEKIPGTSGNVDASGKDVAGAYKLYIGTGSDTKYDVSTENKPAAGAYYGAANKRTSLSFKTADNMNSTMLGQTVGAEDNILIALQDDADNHGKDYFNRYFSDPCEATIVLTAPAKYVDENGVTHIKYKYTADATVKSGSTIPADHYYYNETSGEYVLATEGSTAADITYYTKAPGQYIYTIYLTIDYVMGPTYSGNIQVENCALPGEMIKVSLGDLTVESDPSMPPFGHNWKFGPRTYDAENDRWTMDHEKAYTYKVGTPFDPEADSNETSEMLAGVKYNKDGGYIEVPAYYFMNGYGVEYNFKVTGINEDGKPKDFSVAMRDQDQLTIHNYHRMKPRNADGINRAPVDFKLDLAAKRAAEDAAAVAACTMDVEDALPEPRIYIADASDLNELPRFLGEKAITGYDSDENPIYGEIGSKYDFGNHMQFHLLNDIVVNNVGLSNLQGDHYADKGEATNFKGTLNGNGYVISDLGVKKGEFTAPTYLFATNKGDVYNLGLKQGVITSGDDGTTNTKYHTSYTWSNKTVYRMDGTADNTYTDDDWRYGKVTYDLNQYYLEARKANLSHTADAEHYVEDLFHNGDYLYARWKTASDEYLRTAGASQYDANYNSQTTYHYYSLTDGVLTHPVDESRAVYDESAFDHYAPLYEAAKQNSTLATSEVVKNDFLFFGQKLDKDTKAAKFDGKDEIINVLIPEHIDSDVKRDVSLMDNRVYRAGGYYKSHVSGEPYSTSGGAFFYNRAAYAHDNGITAIDFYGYPESATTWYSPMTDYPTARLASMNRADGVTRNLLVYANNIADTEEGGALKSYLYDEDTPEGNIKMHVIKPVGTATAEPESEKAVTPTTAYLHLVERTTKDMDASGAACANNDFDAPIAFNVTDRAWYTRKPIYYAKNSNDAWEGICLPFTATKVEASLNGEITHFYGTPKYAQSDVDKGIVAEEKIGEDMIPEHNDKTLHHEYWLRGLVSVPVSGTSAPGITANFQRPGATGDGLFSQGTASMYYNFNNNFFVETYGEKNYNTNEPQNVWYTTSHTYADYKPLTANVPYIVSFPGEPYYEFDLSSSFYNSKTGDSEAPQTVTFDNTVPNEGSPIIIGVTNATKQESVANDVYAHKATFIELAATNEIYAMAENGTQFKSDAANVLPFRTYMGTPEQVSIQSLNSNRSQLAKSVIFIGGSIKNEYAEEMEPGDPDSGIVETGLRIYPRGNRVVIESTYPTTINMYSIGGQLIRVLDVREGTNTYSGFGSGIYIVGTKRLLLK